MQRTVTSHLHAGSLTDWEQPLAARGILEQARSAQWEPYRNGWSYPVFDNDGISFRLPDGTPITRWKSFDSYASPKYLWNPGGLNENQRPRYYLLPGTSEAVVQAKGLVYLASGEPDVLAYHAAGMNNVLSWFGEQNVPDTLVDDLKAMGVTTVVSYPDRDDTGKSFAQKIADRLNGSGIAYHAYDLPGEMGSKYDINKLWQDCEFDPDKFRSILAGLLEADLGASASPRQLPLSGQTSSSEPPEGLWAEIEHALGVTRYNANGWSPLVRCPFKTHEHDDQKPAFALNRAIKAGKCQKCGKSAGWKELADALHLRTSSYCQRPLPWGNTEKEAKPKRSPLLADYETWMTWPEPTWLIDGIIPEQATTVMWGSSGVGKSFLAVDYAMRVAQTDHVIYVAGEGRLTYPDRFAAWMKYHSGQPPKLHIYYDRIDLADEASVAQFRDNVAGFLPRLIIFDPLASCAIGHDDSDLGTAGLIMAHYGSLINAFHSTILVVHHATKDGATYRGSTAILAAADCMIKVESKDDRIKVSCDKMRDGAPFEPIWLRALRVEGRPGRWTRVLVPDQNAEPVGMKMPSAERKLLEALSQSTTGMKTEELGKKAKVKGTRLYNALSDLRSKGYAVQDGKGAPYAITDQGLAAIGKSAQSDATEDEDE